MNHQTVYKIINKSNPLMLGIKIGGFANWLSVQNNKPLVGLFVFVQNMHHYELIVWWNHVISFP